MATTGSKRVAADLTFGQYDYLDMARKAFLAHERTSPEAYQFLGSFAESRRRAAHLRRKSEKEGFHVPAILMCSITDLCNLRCRGCYAWANLGDGRRSQLPAEKWGSIFSEAAELGVESVFLMGGEPLARKDVLEEAAAHPELLCFVFTNATLIDEEWVGFFRQKRNMIPLISLEGFKKETDARRGAGVYAAIERAAKSLKSCGVIFGAAVTATKENIHTVASGAFLDEMAAQGARIVEYVEYKPIEAKELALAPQERRLLSETIERAQSERGKMVVVSFPNNSRNGGGCMAAGRAFCHISAAGDMEPCTVMHFSDVSVKDRPLREALDSPFLKRIQLSGILDREAGEGGCALLASQEDLKGLLSPGAQANADGANC